MKKLILSFAAAVIGLTLLVQPVNSEVFLQTDVVEIGVHDSFSFGTSASPPSGFHSNVSYYGLGFVADYGRDGWTVGTPGFSGDFFVPGSPEEGWGVEWTSPSGSEKSFNNFGLMSSFQVPKTSLTDTSSGDVQSATWEGTAASGSEQLRINQTVSVKEGDLFFVMSVSMTNVGSGILHSVEYMRNVDPDQEQPWTSNFTTRNWIEFQPPRPANGPRSNLPARPIDNTDKALAIAEGLDYGLTLGLGTIDSRAVVAASHGFSNRDTDDILNNPNQPTPASPSEMDRAIVLVYELGDLAPGQTVSFDYVYILDKDDLEPALDDLAALTILQPTGTVSGASVLFQATTDDVANTDQIEFFIDDVSIGIDTSPDAGGVFEVSFDSTIYPNGPINLKAVATFNDSRENQKLASVNVENSGPSVAFSTPVSGQLFNGDGIPVAIDILDSSNPPVRVSFFRESAISGSLFLGEDTSEAFTSAFNVSDLPEGETVVIKAVATDALGRATTITVSGSVVTNQDPIAVCKNTTVYLDANGNASITASDVDDGSSDPDPSDSISLSVSPDSFDCSNIGSNAVILTVTDNQDASATCDAIVTVVDNLPPVPDTDPLPQVNGECSATIPAAPTATDNCAGTVTGTTGDPLSYSDQGSYTITWTFDDGNGNTSNQAQNVVVSDVTPPNVQTQNITVQLTADGSASITADAIDNGSTDNCCLGSKSISKSNFTCSDVGENTVTLTVTDCNGNSSSAPATVTVEDNIAPVVLTQDAIAHLDDTCNASITADNINAGSNDACGIASLSLDQDSFTCSDIGENTVTLTVTDNNGNSSSATATVTIPNRPPNIDNAYPSTDCFSMPPDHRMEEISIDGVTDPDGQPVTLEITSITSDEPILSGGCADASIGENGTAELRVERYGRNGRVYMVNFTASDGQAQSDGSVKIVVPYGPLPRYTCEGVVDDGQNYDAADEASCPIVRPRTRLRR